jgi:hypothetical protein
MLGGAFQARLMEDLLSHEEERAWRALNKAQQRLARGQATAPTEIDDMLSGPATYMYLHMHILIIYIYIYI